MAFGVVGSKKEWIWERNGPTREFGACKYRILQYSDAYVPSSLMTDIVQMPLDLRSSSGWSHLLLCLTLSVPLGPIGPD